jgi:hypothetical protein
VNTAEQGNVSIDFLVGVTIFILAFIWVATMIPGILIGLQSTTIDYDAVAYRTGVILTEDPGWPISPPWESKVDSENPDIIRFGLALSKDYPNILAQEKVDRFFCTTFVYPDDYQQRAIFGEYQYRFNISLRDAGDGQTHSVGDLLPDGYGYIRRLAKIKTDSNTTIGSSYFTAHRFINSDNVTTHRFTMAVNYTKLLGDETDLKYQIDPARERIMINITDLRSTINQDPPIGINLTNVQVFGYISDTKPLSEVPFPKSNYPYVDGQSLRVTQFPVIVQDNISFVFDTKDKFFLNMQNIYRKIYINSTFTLTDPSYFLNNSWSAPFDYNYNPENVTQPRLKDAIVEVAVW